MGATVWHIGSTRFQQELEGIHRSRLKKGTATSTASVVMIATVPRFVTLHAQEVWSDRVRCL